MFQMPAKEIGGAIVRRTFSCGGKQLQSGMKLTAEQVLAMPTLNRMALVDKRYMDLVPVASTQAKGERFVMHDGSTGYFVLEGRYINDEALDREQAYALAGKSDPMATLAEQPEKPARKKRQKRAQPQ